MHLKLSVGLEDLVDLLRGSWLLHVAVGVTGIDRYERVLDLGAELHRDRQQLFGVLQMVPRRGHSSYRDPEDKTKVNS